MSLRNNLISGGEGKDVAHAAKLMVRGNAVLPDSPRSKDTYLSQARPSVTSSCCVHQFVRSQNEFDSSNSCGHDPQQYIFLVKMVLIIKTNAPFL